MPKPTQQDLRKYQAVILRPESHGIAEHVARMAPASQPLGLCRDILKLCKVKFDKEIGQWTADRVYDVLWIHTFDLPLQTNKFKHQGVPITENPWDRIDRFHQSCVKYNGLKLRKPSDEHIIAVLDHALIDFIDGRDPRSLYLKLRSQALQPEHWMITETGEEATNTQQEPTNMTITTKKAQPKTKTTKAKKKNSKSMTSLMDGKRVQAAKDQIHDLKITKCDPVDEGYDSQCSVLLGGGLLGRLGKDASKRGAKKWTPLFPTNITGVYFKTKKDCGEWMREVCCGHDQLWNEKTKEVHKEITTGESENACRVYGLSINNMGEIEGTIYFKPTDQDKREIGNFSTVLNRASGDPHRNNLCTLLVKNPSDWDLIRGAVHGMLSEWVTVKPLEIDQPENGDDSSDTIVEIYSGTPYNPEKAAFEHKQPTIGQLLDRIKEGEIDLNPEFQRGAGLWSSKAQSRLIESILLGIPLPVFIFKENNKGHWIVVDGLQRLSALANFCLNMRKLKHMEYLGDLNGKTFANLDRKWHRKIMEHQIQAYVISSATPPEVTYNIFKRYNTGGLKLTGQEMRHALNQGQATRLLAEMVNLTSFQSATRNNGGNGPGIASKRMQDRECALRWCAFMLKDPAEYRGGMDQFLTSALSSMNDHTDKKLAALKTRFDQAMQRCDDLLAADVFRLHYERNPEKASRINKAIFETQSVSIGMLTEDQYAILYEARDAFRNANVKLLEDEFYESAVTAATGSTASVQNRHDRYRQMITDVIRDWATSNPKGLKKAKNTKTEKKKEAQTQPADTGVVALESISMDSMRQVCRDALRTKQSVKLPSGIVVVIDTEKRNGKGRVFLATNMLTNETHTAPNPQSLVKALRSIA